MRTVSYLDLPELDVIGHVSPGLERLAQDPALHRVRIRVVTPARIQHFLFAYGGNLRPSVVDLVQWNVLRGLGIERRWRTGAYLYSPQVRARVFGAYTRAINLRA